MKFNNFCIYIFSYTAIILVNELIFKWHRFLLFHFLAVVLRPLESNKGCAHPLMNPIKLNNVEVNICRSRFCLLRGPLRT